MENKEFLGTEKVSKLFVKLAVPTVVAQLVNLLYSMSMLALIGQLVSPIFRPLGFTDWRAATALITGFSAKEAVISTLSVLVGGNINAMLPTIFTTKAAISFLVFTLLYTPCVAAIAAVKRELHSRSMALLVVVGQTVFAWCVAAIVYNVIMLF